VINTNLHSILHRFRGIADYWSNFRFWHGVHTRSKWTPKLRTTKFGLKKLETLSYGLDIFIDDYFVLSQCTCLTAGQTDRYRQEELASNMSCG